MTVDVIWLQAAVGIGATGALIANRLGWARGFSCRGKIDDEHLAKVIPIQRDIGWLRAAQGLPREDKKL